MTTWWSNYELETSHTLRWELGPTTLWVTRDDLEWRVARRQGSDPLDNRLSIAETASEPTGDDIDVQRFLGRRTHPKLRLRPALPDRPVIVKTAKPFFVPPNEEATLFVSTILWLRVYLGEGAGDVIDAAIVQPSDTWFGPDTMTGELCYALRTTARVHLNTLRPRPHRAISVVRIRNNATSILQIDKLKVPVPYLSLFASEEGHLWTEALTLERREDSSGATVRLDQEPSQVVTVKKLARPRKRMSKGLFADVFGRLFQTKDEGEDVE